MSPPLAGISEEFCGQVFPPLLRSSSNRLYLKFKISPSIPNGSFLRNIPASSIARFNFEYEEILGGSAGIVSVNLMMNGA